MFKAEELNQTNTLAMTQIFKEKTTKQAPTFNLAFSSEKIGRIRQELNGPPDLFGKTE